MGANTAAYLSMMVSTCNTGPTARFFRVLGLCLLIIYAIRKDDV